LYIATAPKSNATYRALAAARQDVKEHGALPVPPHLRDAHYPGAKRLGHGEGYLYPHDYPGHYVPQEYLPSALAGRRYYVPSDQGYERELARRLEAWRQQRPEQGARRLRWHLPGQGVYCGRFRPVYMELSGAPGRPTGRAGARRRA